MPDIERTTASPRRPQRIGAVLLVTLGVGHLVLAAIFQGTTMLDWVAKGLWAAVPLRLGAEPSVELLHNALVFWSSVGSFAVPSILLGVQQWALAGRGVTSGPWLGWGVIGWFVVLTLLLVPSPGILGVVAGVLLLIAARRARLARS